MTSRKQHASGDTSLTTRKRQDSGETSLQVDVKVNILHTIADAIYATPAGKIREAVANSRDNDATWVLIVVDQTNRRLSILDDGSGIDRDTFTRIFQSIGDPLQRARSGALSYFGLGLMSVFQLGDRVKLFTRPRDSHEMLCLEVDAAAIFDRANRSNSISSLHTCLHPLRRVKEPDRRRASVNTVNLALDSGTPVSMPSSFTEIIIEDVPMDVLDEMGDPDFITELSQVLPLRPRVSGAGQSGEPFLTRFTGEKRKDIIALLKNDTYCKTIDVFFAIHEDTNLVGKPQIPQLWKYFPRFKSQITFPDDNVTIGTSKDGSFAYYAAFTYGDDLEERPGSVGTQDGDGVLAERETGFWIRNQNFLAKRADFLDKPGPGRKPRGSIHKPLRPWVFGEVFHTDMNEFLTVSRNDFLYSELQFGQFRDAFLDEVAGPINPQIRRVWDKRKPILDHFVDPFAEVAEKGGPLLRVESSLRLLMGDEMSDREFHETVKAHLENRRERSIEDDKARIDVLLSRRKEPLVLGTDEGAVVRVVPTLAKPANDPDVRWNDKSKKVVVDVSPLLFAMKPVKFLGDTFHVVFVVGKGKDAGVSIDTTKKLIYLNPFNGDLCQFSVTILDVYIALQIADAVSNSQKALKQNFLRLLGATSPVTAKYVTPLGDDLRRSVVYK